MNKELYLKVTSFPIFDQPFSFSCFSGDLHILYGKNGSGKTTLLRNIALSKTFENSSVNLQTSVSYLGDKFGLKLNESVSDHLNFFASPHAIKGDMPYFLDRYTIASAAIVQNLSFGQMQKVGLIRVLLSRSNLWILDEPLSHLDDQSRLLFIDDMQSHLSFGGAILMSTHDKIPLLHESIILS